MKEPRIFNTGENLENIYRYVASRSEREKEGESDKKAAPPATNEKYDSHNP